MGPRRRRTVFLLRTIGFLMLVSCLQKTEARPGPQLPIRADSDAPAEVGPLCPPSCAHVPRRPVCGADGVTYASRCHLRRARCDGTGIVTLQHPGACRPHSGVSKCQQKRAEALQGHPDPENPPNNIFVPECQPNGLYAEVQCHRGSGHCWCVDSYGVAVKGTAVLRARPECSARRVRTSAKGKRARRKHGRRRGCGARAKTIFRNNVMLMIKNEYSRRRRQRTGSRREDNLAKLAAEWKFSRLDKNHDGQLSRHEIRRLRKKARARLKPLRCARTFARYCDTDGSRSLGRQEWLLCVGVSRDDISFRTFLALNEGSAAMGGGAPLSSSSDAAPSAGAALGPAGRSSTFEMLLGEETAVEETPEEEHSCAADRRQALDNQRLSELEGKHSSFFIPSCTADNKYSRVQCHNSTGFCWCADPDTGQSLQQGHVKDRLPDCSQATAAPSAPGKTRRKGNRARLPRVCRDRLTIQYLMDYLTNKMVRALQQGLYKLPTDSGGEVSFEAKVAEWKFLESDRNDSGSLERREWRALRLELGGPEFSGDPVKRRCGRRLPRYCDADADRSISKHEWLACTGAVEEENQTEKTPNPFEQYLISD